MPPSRIQQPIATYSLTLFGCYPPSVFVAGGHYIPDAPVHRMDTNFPAPIRRLPSDGGRYPPASQPRLLSDGQRAQMDRGATSDGVYGGDAY